jgi:hypothetical protein
LSPPIGLAKLFKSIDADGSGTITVEELKKALQDWGHKIHDVSFADHGCATVFAPCSEGLIPSTGCGRHPTQHMSL